VKRLCEDCRGVGFLLMQNDTHGLRIERCDACRKYRSDEAAVTAAFRAGVGAMRPGWRRVSNERVRHRWDLACGCRNVERTVYMLPDFCAGSGTPICEECGEDRRYVSTEVRMCTTTKHA
jgi:hypothetical protein